MFTEVLHVMAMIFSVSILVSSSCCRKKTTIEAPIYHLHNSNVLPSDIQVTTFLGKGESKRFVYTSSTNRGGLSATLITCTSPIQWSFRLENLKKNSTLVTNVMQTYHVPPKKGVYTLQLLAVEADTFAHIYISTEEGGPQALQNTKFANLRLVKRQRRKRVTVKWNPSLVDPQVTDYCIVVSTQKPHESFCSAIKKSVLEDPVIACVGRKTHYTMVPNPNHYYFFNIFAFNHQSNLTYLYGNTSGIFKNSKPPNLKDGVAAFVNLKKLDGKAVYRYKLGKEPVDCLEFFVMPCGGTVDVEITLKDLTVIAPRRIEGFGKISILQPVQSARYYIKIFALNNEELKKTVGVEIYVKSKSSSTLPLPNMPKVVKLQEYKGLTTCNSVTIAWMAASVKKTVYYCVLAKEGKIRETDVDNYKIPNQCGLEKRLKKSTVFAVKYCTNAKFPKEQVVVEKIKDLKPGRHYIIQVTVKKPKGKTLSYDLLQVFTKPSCDLN